MASWEPEWGWEQSPDWLQLVDKADADRKREKEDGPQHDEWCWIACPHDTNPDDPALD